MSAKSVSISVVLPALNEEANLEATVSDAIAALDTVATTSEIIIVNDGSTDGTEEIAQSLSAKDPRVRVVTHAENKGYGAAVRTGIGAAQLELVLLSDGDGQFFFADLPRFVSSIDGCDGVIGYRQFRADPLHRSLLSKTGNFVARRTLGIQARDINCAFKLLRRDLLQALSFTTDGEIVSTELLARGMKNGWRLRELPVSHRPRKHGSPTGARPAVIWRTIVEFFALRQALRK